MPGLGQLQVARGLGWLLQSVTCQETGSLSLMEAGTGCRGSKIRSCWGMQLKRPCRALPQEVGEGSHKEKKPGLSGLQCFVLPGWKRDTHQHSPSLSSLFASPYQLPFSIGPFTLHLSSWSILGVPSALIHSALLGQSPLHVPATT